MANPNRKMATVRRIDSVTPIDGADRIECAHIGGWQTVVRKGDFAPGDLCVYYEIDTFFPQDDPRYEFLTKHGTRQMERDGRTVMGHVLRTARLRGCLSQGLAMRPEDVMPEGMPESRYAELCDEGANVSSIVGVWEYDPGITMTAGFTGRYDTYVAPRTDAERVQNVSQRVFDLVRRTSYYTNVKADGTSVTLVNDPRTGEVAVYSHNNRFDTSMGIGKVAWDAAVRQGLDAFLDDFPGFTLQAELCGPKIGGNPYGLGEYRLFAFSLWDMDARGYMCPYVLQPLCGMLDSASALVGSCVPTIGDGAYGSRFLDRFDTPQDLIEWTDGLSGQIAEGRLDEGVVVHVLDAGMLPQGEQAELRNALGPTMQMKSVSNAFLLGRGE